MKCSRFPLQEVSNRIHEKFDQIKNTSENKYPKFSKQLHETQLLSGDKVYEKVVLENFFSINTNCTNNKFIMLKNNDLVFVEQIIVTSNHKIKFLVKKCNIVSPFFNLPSFSSKDINSCCIDIEYLSVPYLT